MKFRTKLKNVMKKTDSGFCSSVTFFNTVCLSVHKIHLERVRNVSGCTHLKEIWQRSRWYPGDETFCPAKGVRSRGQKLGLDKFKVPTVLE